MADLGLSIALERYDRHMALMAGIEPVDGVTLDVHEVGQSTNRRHGTGRHRRVLVDGEFDIGEVSLASYITMVDRGDGDELAAVPVFPRRLFSASQLWCRADSALTHPRELPGTRVGVVSYQVTLSVLFRGDLARDHGVDWRDVEWVAEKADVIDRQLPAGARVSRTREGRHAAEELADGTIDALAMPHPPATLWDDTGRFRRVVEDPRAEDSAYFRTHGYWPIMHLIAVRRRLLDEHPWLGPALIDAFNRSLAFATSLGDDPNGTFDAWGRHAAEEHAAVLGPDAWANGLGETNRRNLADFLDYCVDQGIAGSQLAVDDLFHPTVR